MKRVISFTLLLCMLLCAASCGGADAPAADDTMADSTADVQTEPDVSLRENTPDTLPDDLDFGGAKVRIAVNGSEAVMTREVGLEETNGDVVNDALYHRRRSVEERLNVKLDYLATAAETADFREAVRTTLTAGDDAYDIVIAHQSFGLPQALEGLYHNLADAPYLDYSQPWWNTGYMSSIEITEDSRYMLAGDICSTFLLNMGSVFFNKSLYEDNFGDPMALYQTALDGNWTLDHLMKLCSDVSRDLDQNGTFEVTDVLGMYASTVTTADLFAYAAGLTLTERDADGLPQLKADQSRNVTVMEKLKTLYYETPGIVLATKDATLLAEGVQTFVGGTALFFPERFSRMLALREMKDLYGILPYPKVDTQQKEYRTTVHDYTTLFSVPITVADIDMSCAVLEALCAESYRTVIPAWYETALKVKFTHDDISAQVIDLIYENAAADFMYANNYYFSSAKLGTIQRTILGSNGEYMSQYASMEESVKALLAKLISETTGA